VRTTFAIVGGNAKAGSAVSGTGLPQAGTLHAALIATAKSISPAKTWGYIARLTGAGERVAKHRVAGTRTFSADEIAALLRSEQGIHFLVAIMADARPKWWKTLLRMGVLGGIERRREADLKLLRKVAHVADETAAELPAALMLQDSEFYGPVFDALDSA
jgi:hypothetical protein